MESNELSRLDATAQAELVRRKQVSPLELVDAAIARIERGNPKINAVVTTQFERAREQAQGKLPDGPFRGVPFLLKDLNAADPGVPMTQGSRFLRSFVPDWENEIVTRYKQAGLVIVGRTNTPEWGIPPTTEPLLFGPTKNPFALGHSAGGSSGGAAAAVAARFVPAAHASDAGGSIRIPASCCGVFGLKPTRGRNPMGPKLGESPAGFIAEHVVSISVRDSAALLDATGFPGVGDPYAAPAKARPFAEEVGAVPGRLRIAIMRVPVNGVEVHADCLEALEATATLCKELGHSVKEKSIAVADPGELFSSFLTVWFTAAAMNVRVSEQLAGRSATEDDLEPVTRALAALGRDKSAVDFVDAARRLHRISREVARFFSDFDVVVTPTLAAPPVQLGEIDNPPDDPLRGFLKAGSYAAFTPLFNVTGQPAMSVPLHWNAAGLPIGLQFAARFGDEATLFRLAAQLEQARPWADRLPPV